MYCRVESVDEVVGEHAGHEFAPATESGLGEDGLHVIEFDNTGLITRENVWLDYPGISAQLTDDPPKTHTDEHSSSCLFGIA